MYSTQIWKLRGHKQCDEALLKTEQIIKLRQIDWIKSSLLAFDQGNIACKCEGVVIICNAAREVGVIATSIQLNETQHKVFLFVNLHSSWCTVLLLTSRPTTKYLTTELYGKL